MRDWWELVGRAGWTAPHYPHEWGGKGFSARSAAVVRAAFAAHGAVPPPGGIGLIMAAPTITTHGTPEQIERLVPPIYSGAAAWCQLFSEPGSGSDLAGLTTRAVRDGNRWVISGQKVWSSQAVNADYGMLLARTDPDAPKHGGISWFAFPLDQPGVTIRPLREITGRALFSEVFIDEAVVDDADLVGGRGQGWAVAQTTLFHERTGIGAGGANTSAAPAGARGGFLDLRSGEAAAIPAADGSKAVVRVPEILDLVTKLGRAGDPLLRQEVARLYTYWRTGEWTARRTQQPNLSKLAQTRILKLSADVIADVLGADAMLWAPDGYSGGEYTESLVFALGSSIYGGTDQIQRNVVGERVLGLPRDVDPMKGRPFREMVGLRRM